MLSFKSIAGFLKKVSSSTRDDATYRDPRASLNATAGDAAASGYNISSSTTALSNTTTTTTSGGSSVGGTGAGGKMGSPGRFPNSGASLAAHDASKESDLNFMESPLTGMPCTFSDTAMFASSSVLKGLPPNTSTQDVLLHIQSVLRRRQEELDEQLPVDEGECPSTVVTTRGDRTPAMAWTDAEDDHEDVSVATTPLHRGKVGATAALGDGGNVSKTSTAATSAATVVGGVVKGTKSDSRPNTTTTTTTVRIGKEQLLKLQHMRAEMMDALDVCLQEVPEEALTPATNGNNSASVAVGPGSDAERGKEESSATPPAAVSSGDAKASPSPEPVTDAVTPTAVSASEAGQQSSAELARSRRPSSFMAPPGNADPIPWTASTTTTTVANPAFTHYEWRDLLLRIVEVLARIDRALMTGVRRRVLEKLTSVLTLDVAPLSTAAAPATSASTGNLTALHTAASTPTRTAGGVQSAAASTVLNSPSLLFRSYGSRGTAAVGGDEGEANAAVELSAPPTPTESGLPFSSTTTAFQVSPAATIKRALVDGCVLAHDARPNAALSKEEMRLVEELLTVACSLATWAIIQAILRHHLSELQGRRGTVTGSAAVRMAGTRETLNLEASQSISLAHESSAGASGGVSGISGRPPLAPPPPPPLVVAAAVAAASANHTVDGGATLEPTVEECAKPEDTTAPSRVPAHDDIPYIDWKMVVHTLACWLGYPNSTTLAECTLCASFLRDDGREMVLCMLQHPKPRRLLTSIQHRAEKLRRTDPSVLFGANPTTSTSAAPGTTTTATASAGTSTAVPTAAAGAVPRGAANGATPTPAPSTSSSGSAAVPSTTANTTAVAAKGATSAAAPSYRSVMEDPGAVMDDLVAHLEATYRRAVGDTWSRFLEDTIEAEMESSNAGAAAAAAAANCVSCEQALADHKRGAGEEEVPAPLQEEESFSRQGSAATTVTPVTALSSSLTMTCITDTKTLCRLATAYFFGSDTWPEKKRERRFAVLHRSMRSRTEQYSESAATRRIQRRGMGGPGCSQTFTATTTAVASPVEQQPLSDLLPSPLPTSRIHAAAASTATTTLHTSRATPQQSTTNPFPVQSANAPSPTKFSVEDTAARAPPSGAIPRHQLAGTAGGGTTNTNATSGSAASVSLVTHHFLSSNASNAGISAQSTPLAGSLLMSRDGGAAEAEGAVSAVRLGAVTVTAGHPMDADVSIGGTAEQSVTWLPFGFMMPGADNMTPPPELPSQQQMASGPEMVTPRRDGGADGRITKSSEGSISPFPQQQQQASVANNLHCGVLVTVMLERMVNMAWSAALHKRGEQCLTVRPPRLEEAEADAQEERLVAGVFREFRARQRALVSLINARLASGKSVEALTNAQKHFRFEKKDWTGHDQTIFSAMRYLQSMVLLVRAQAACRVYGAVIETVQFVLPQATMCEQMLQVLAPRPRGDFVLRFADYRSKLLRSYVFLLKEFWLAHAAFNDLVKADRYFIQCAQVIQLLRRRQGESELFAVYMERGSQLLRAKSYKRAIGIFRAAVNVSKKSLLDSDTATAAATSTSTAAAPTSVSTGSGVKPSATTTTPSSAPAVGSANTSTQWQQFHRNLHLRSAGSGSLTTAEEHVPGTSSAVADDLEFAWRVAESERMLALSYVTEAEHEVNVRERREELSNAVSNAYSSQRSLQRWQTKGGTPKRLLTAVPCSLIVICKGLLLLNQARKAALLLEPLIENKPSSALVRPPMWREILLPTEDPYTAEDVVLRTYVCSVKIAVYMLYARCLAEFDGERALRAVAQVDQLLQEGDTWIYAIRTQLRRALEEVRMKDGVAAARASPPMERAMQLPSMSAAAVSAITGRSISANDDGDEGRSPSRRHNNVGNLTGCDAETVDSNASTAATAGTGVVTNRMTEVPPLRMPHIVSSDAVTTGTSSSSGMAGATYEALSSASGIGAGHGGPEGHALEERSLPPRAGAAGEGTPRFPREDPHVDEEVENRSRESTSILAAPAMTTSTTTMSGAVLTGRATTTIDGWHGTTHTPVQPSHGTLSTSSAMGTSTLAASAPAPTAVPLRIHMESASEGMTALFALREGKSHIRKAFRDAFIVSGDAHALIRNWEEALKSYSHALVIAMSEVEAANAAAQTRRRGNAVYPAAHHPMPSPHTSVRADPGDDSPSQAHYTNADNNNAMGTHVNLINGGGHPQQPGGGANANSNSAAQCWGQVVPLDEEFFLWDEEDVLIADNLVSRELTASTAAKDLRAVVADEERMDSRACESLVLSKLANVYRALDKPTTAIHYHNLVLDYANECHDKLLAYNSMLSLARLYTAASAADEAREAWANVSDLAKEYEDKEVSRETKRNIVAGQESAGMYLEVVKTAEELEKLATGEEGDDAAADRRFALEALANANLQLGQYDACITALDNREKVQEKSAEWNGRLLSMRAKARMGLNKPTDAIKVMQSWAVKARSLLNWVELGKANSALSAAYASENQNMQARHYHEATLNAFSLAETLNEDCQHIALDSARWLVHYAYLDDATVQIDPALTFDSSCLTSDSEASGGDFRYTDSGLCNSSGDLGAMLAREEELRRSSSSLFATKGTIYRGLDDASAVEEVEEEDEDDFFNGGALSGNSVFGMRYTPGPGKEEAETEEVTTRDRTGEEGAASSQRDGPSDLESNVDSGSSPKLSVVAPSSFSSSTLPSDPSCATLPPSLVSSMSDPFLRDDTAAAEGAAGLGGAGVREQAEVNYSGSSAGQSDVGDNEMTPADEHEEENRNRREVDEALQNMDAEDVREAVVVADADLVATAAAAARRSGMIFRMSDADNNMGFDDDDDDQAEDGSGGGREGKSTAPSKAPSSANVTTAAPKPSTGVAVGGGKSATNTYVPPPTALANVSICSRPAAAAAGTDVLEMLVGTGGAAAAAGNVELGAGGGGSNGLRSPVLSSGPRTGGTMVSLGGATGTALGGAEGNEEGHAERKPATVRTTYHRGAIEMMETAAQLLLVSRCVSRLVVPYSPAEAVDFALLAHPQSLFVFYFAEYTSEYGAQCDVVIRPPGAAAFLKLRTQVSLKEYHSKDILKSVLSTLAVDPAMLSGRAAPAAATMDGAASSHPFGGAMTRGTSGMADTAPTLSNVQPDALRAALDEETRLCLRNLHADAWQPVMDRLQREHVSYEDADTVVIMPDIALLHIPFAGLLPSPDYGGADAPLGEQFTLIVTPSLTHLVSHGMVQDTSSAPCGAVDPSAKRYLFLPYDANSVPVWPALSVPPSPRVRAPLSARTAKGLNSASSAFLHLTPPTSVGDAAMAAAATTSTGTRRDTLQPPAEAEESSFEALLKTWRVHRGCTRKELIHAFTDSQTRAIMLLAPVDQGFVRVADGVVTLQDIMQSLQQARAMQLQLQQTSGVTAAAVVVPPPPLCTHMDFMVTTTDRGQSPSVSHGGMAADLCMMLGVNRVLRLNVVPGLAPTDEHRAFIALFLANLKRAVRWSLDHSYAVALRTTIAEARAKGMSSNTWGAFTLVGTP